MYLAPNKFMDLNLCTLKIGTEILKILLEKKKIKYRVRTDVVELIL